ncbi:hypothetical protein E3O47_12435 [Cryobacterium sp. TMT2-17-1]|uniref:hypothetical protein n=1 Tax=Cryobacterium sp. TMT2-17-1 TaxID=1259248 RepID=UPI00106D1F53|nr:hypothetical protein [Cryobacterium sp. TMT2-17-1]TFC49066.1 hypothetical protein E3O47_12435 [Cryobacterium sp. TMT2-17-1]
MTARQNGFSTNTRQTVAARAGHRCSFRGCEASTSGPSASSSQRATQNGWACHIFPAGAGGPRSTLPPGQIGLESLENAVWMCETHGTLIDKNNGEDYPPQLLLKWRVQAEMAASLAQGSSFEAPPSIDFIWIEGSEPGTQIFEFKDIHLEIFDFTVLYANHDQVLSLICRSLAHAPEFPTEALSHLGSNQLKLSIGYSPGYRPQTRICFESGRVKYWDGQISTNSIAGFYEVVLVDRSSLVRGIPAADRGWFSREGFVGPHPREILVSKDPMLTEKMVEQLRDEDNVMVDEIRLRDGQWDVRCLKHTPGQFFRLEQLSSSEQMSVHLDLTLAFLRIAARQRPASPFLLVVDNVLWCYDEKNLAKFAAICGRLPRNVQVLVSDATGHVAQTLKVHRQDLKVSERTTPPGYLVEAT